MNKRLSELFWFLLLYVLVALPVRQAVAQVAGQVSTAASPAVNPMDPDGDGFITLSGTAFSDPLADDQSEFEIPYIAVQQAGGEPNSDLQTGSTCGPTDIIDNSATGADGGYIYLDDPDGILGNGDENLLFRMRIAKDPTGAFGYSFLIDTDLKFGFTGPDADPNAISGNPGYEYEVILGSGGSGKGVKIANVDNSASGTAIKTYDYATNHQRAYARSGDPSCSGKVVFMDFYIAFQDLGISATAPIRVTYATSSSPSSALGGSASDIGGIDGKLVLSDDDQFQAAIDAVEPISFASLDDTEATYTVVPAKATSEYTDGEALATCADADGSITSASLNSGSLPAGLALGTDGTISVTDQALLVAGSYSVEITTVDALGGSTIHNITLTLNSAGNAAPTSANQTVSTNEDTPYLFISTDFAFSDADGDNFAAVLITVLPTNGTLNYNGAEVLASDISGATAFTDRSLFEFISDPHMNGTGYATFSFKVKDDVGNASSSAYTMTIDVNAINDDPVTSLQSNSQNTQEETALTFNSGNNNLMAVSDADGDAQTVTIQVTHGLFSLSQTTGLTFTTGDGTEDPTIQFSGSLADINAALSGSTFTPAANYAGSATLDVSTDDGNGGTDSQSMSIDVSNINDAPTGADNTISTNEDADYTFLVSDFAFNDDDPADQLDHILITSLPLQGNLFLDSNGNGVVDSGEVIGVNDGVLTSDITKLKFKPVSDANGIPYAQFGFKVNDGTTDATAENTLTINVTALNDDPVIAAASHDENTLKNTNLIFQVANGNHITVSDADGDVQSIAIAITNGTFSLSQISGLAFLTGDGSLDASMSFSGTMTDINAALEGATFTPSTNFTGTVSLTMTTDDGNGGTDNETVTIEVLASNQAPVVSSFNTSVNEDEELAFALIDFSSQFNDSDGDPISKVIIKSLPDHGRLELDQISVVEDQVIDATELGNLVYIPEANFNGSTSFDWNASDGTVYATSNASVKISVVAVQDAPSVNNVTKTTSEDQSVSFTVADFTSQFSDADGESLQKIQITSLPDNGSLYLDGVAVSLNEEIVTSDIEKLTFEPAADFNELVTFAWNGSDGNDYAASGAEVQITIQPVNDHPEVSNLPKSGSEDSDMVFEASDFTSHYSDTENSALTFIKVLSLPLEGTLKLNETSVLVNDEIAFSDLGNLVFVPNADFYGIDSFQWNASDGPSYADRPAEVQITINPVQDAPVISDIAKLGTEDQTMTFASSDFTDQFSDADDENLQHIQIISLPVNGTLFLNGIEVQVNDIILTADLATLSLVPNADFNGPMAISWNASDGTDDAISPAFVNITFGAIQDRPTVGNFTKVGPENQLVSFTLTDFTDKFTDVDDEAMQKITITALPSSGSLKLNGTTLLLNEEITTGQLANLIYEPVADFNGTIFFGWNGYDGVAYAASDATVQITIESQQDAPVVSDFQKSGEEDSPISLITSDFTDNFSDVDGETLQKIQIITLPSSGALLLNGLPVQILDEIVVADLDELLFVPEENFNGIVSFTWNATDGIEYAASNATVELTVSAVQDAPVVSEISKTGDEDQTVGFTFSNFTSQFSDADDETLQLVQIKSLPANGFLYREGVAVNVGDELTAADLDQLTFVPDRDFFGIASFLWNATDGIDYANSDATISISVQAVQDQPVVSSISKSSSEDQEVRFSVSDFTSHFEDADGESLQKVVINSLPSNGLLYLTNTLINIHQEIAVSDLANIRFVPSGNFYGTTSFAWNGSDGIDYADIAALAELNITSVQDLPTVNEVSISTEEGAAVQLSIADFVDQFNDEDGESLQKIHIVTLPAHGQLYINDVAINGSVHIAVADMENLVYQPTEGFSGLDEFLWNGSDGFAFAENNAKVMLTIEEVQKPVVSDVDKITKEDQTVTFSQADFAGAFAGPNGASLQKIKISTLPTDGTLSLNGVAIQPGVEITVSELDQLTFTPAEGYFGTVSFPWVASDGTYYSSQEAFIRIVVEPSDDEAPVVDAGDAEISVEEGLATGDLSAYVNESSGKGFTFSTTPIEDVLHGTLVIHSDGTFTYIPDAGFVGTDSFTYEVCDQETPGNCSQGTFTITITSTDDQTDSDGDGISDAVEKGDDPANPKDSDQDGVPDYLDTDSDNDGISDEKEIGENVHQPVDSDDDGTPDYLDTDSDGDGIADQEEAGKDGASPPDTDQDGIPDYLDTDSDNDGLTDQQEAQADDGKPADNDQDGIPDYLDSDSDGDGIPDATEAGLNPGQPIDTDGDGIPDYLETDSDGDGINDHEEAGEDPLHPADTDGDGIPDFQETDSDGDGIVDGDEDVITIYKGFSPDGDGVNDTWVIPGIEQYPGNTVQIFNRWGNKIFEVKGYNNKDKAWGSQSNVGMILVGKEIPDGTYFYSIDLKNGEKARTGYVVINR